MKPAERAVHLRETINRHNFKYYVEAAPEIYFETDHYKGWPAVLVRLRKIKAAELKHRLARAWRLKAPKRLIKSFDER